MNTYYIYSINRESDLYPIYVGKTKDFERRQIKHKIAFCNENGKHYNYKLYKYIRENCGWSNFYFKLIIECECEKIKSIEYEKFYIELFDTLRFGNTRLPQVIDKTGEEWRKEYSKQNYIDNRNEILEKQKQYRIENRDKILEQKKQHYYENKDEILEKQKQYRIENRDEILEQKKQWYNENKEKIKERQNQKSECECGGKYTHVHKARHLNSIKHQNYLLNK